MSSSHLIINSKIHIPTLRTNIVLRQQVFEKLNQWDAGLLLISAPAGYGKTTTLASWVHKYHFQCAWLSLDTEDSFPRFVMYLFASLQIEYSTDEIGSYSPEAVILILSNNLSRLTLLVLEDYHLIQNSSIHMLVENIIQHLNEKIRLIIITRQDPPLPLAKWRAHRQLTEIRAEDLCFTNDETTLFFKQVMKMDLPAQAVSMLEAQTEGWVTGLQLAGLSKNINSFNIQGDQRNIADYLMAEVLKQLPNDLKFFLLQTSILKQLSASLCNAVTNRDDSQMLLGKIESENLFIFSLDAIREWFRYHHLFSEFLYKQLKVEFPEKEVQILHSRASHWFEKNELIPEAIDHALAAKDFECAAHLIAPQADEWMRRGEINTILEKLKQLPDEVAERNVDLCVWYGWVFAITNEVQLAEYWLVKAEQSINSYLSKVAQGTLKMNPMIRNGHPQIFAIRALLARQQNNYSLAIQLSKQALSMVPEDNIQLQAVVSAGLSSAKIGVGDFSQADEITLSTQHMARRAKNPFITFTMLMNETVLGILRGQLFKVYESSHEALQLCERESMPHLSFLPHIRLGRVHYLWNQLPQAEEHMLKGIQNPQFPEYALSICNGIANLALLYHAQGKTSQAFETLENMKEIAKTYQIENGVARAQALQAMIHLSSDETEHVKRWFKTSGWGNFNTSTGRINFPDDSFSAFCCYRIFYEKDWRYTENILQWRLENATQKNRIGILVETHLFFAILYQNENQNDLALQSVYQALKVAEPENFIRPFVDREKQIYQMLNRISTTHEAYGFAQKIISKFVTLQNHSSNLIESLNEQEMKILQLLAQGKSNPEIAKQLSFAVSTVRWYVKHIYRKLGVHNRTQATLEAQKQNLI